VRDAPVEVVPGAIEPDDDCTIALQAVLNRVHNPLAVDESFLAGIGFRHGHRIARRCAKSNTRKWRYRALSDHMSRARISVPISDTTIEPMHPSRFEKNANMEN
jgi:hypothetical protein